MIELHKIKGRDRYFLRKLDMIHQNYHGVVDKLTKRELLSLADKIYKKFSTA